MKCEVDREFFSECLQGVVNTIPTRTTYPVLQNILLEVKSGRLIMAATDLDTYVRKEIPVHPESKTVAGKAILLGRKLLEVVRELTDPLLVLSKTNASIKLESGKNVYTFAGLDPAEYPEPPAMPSDVVTDFPLPVLEDAFAASGFAVSKDESRPVATGVCWEIDPTEMRMIATDTHRLAFVRKLGEFKVKSRLILPPKVFNLIPKGESVQPEPAQGGDAKEATGTASPPCIKIKADASKVGLELGHTTIISRLIEGPYLDYDRVIPKNHPNRLKVKREQLGAALRRAAVFANPVARPVTFDLKPDSVRILAETAELGQAEENLDATYTGAEMSIAFNATFLLEFLHHIESEDVTMELGSSGNAGLVHPDQPEPDRLYLLMPIRMD